MRGVGVRFSSGRRPARCTGPFSNGHRPDELYFRRPKYSVIGNARGVALHPWGGSPRTKRFGWGGVLTLIATTMIIGYGNYLVE